MPIKIRNSQFSSLRLEWHCYNNNNQIPHCPRIPNTTSFLINWPAMTSSHYWPPLPHRAQYFHGDGPASLVEPIRKTMSAIYYYNYNYLQVWFAFASQSAATPTTSSTPPSHSRYGYILGNNRVFNTTLPSPFQPAAVEVETPGATAGVRKTRKFNFCE